ncbi:hypothetical protein TFLX_01103 [Thermoflexales bacterium]|nr:hypothetical protein TFLX_01103 [Thermoflexales bacterium]
MKLEIHLRMLSIYQPADTAASARFDLLKAGLSAV